MNTANCGGDRKLISVVSPCYNEEEVIRLFYGKLKESLDSLEHVDYEIILVDDGSTDDTLEILYGLSEEDERLKICALSRNFGHQVALSAGLDRAGGDAVIMMDSDLQHPPELIGEMTSLWEEGYDVVSTVRQYPPKTSWFKKATSYLFYRLINFMSDVTIPAGAADFCLLSRDVYEALRRMPERHRFLRGMIAWTGYRRTYIPYSASERAGGESKYTFMKMVSLALHAAMSFSTRPIHLGIRLGLIILLAGVGYLVWILIRYLFLGGHVPGWTSLIAVILVIGGMQLLFISLIGQYIVYLYEESKQRPLYLTKSRRPEGCPHGES